MKPAIEFKSRLDNGLYQVFPFNFIGGGETGKGKYIWAGGKMRVGEWFEISPSQRPSCMDTLKRYFPEKRFSCVKERKVLRVK